MMKKFSYDCIRTVMHYGMAVFMKPQYENAASIGAMAKFYPIFTIAENFLRMLEQALQMMLV